MTNRFENWVHTAHVDDLKGLIFLIRHSFVFINRKKIKTKTRQKSQRNKSDNKYKRTTFDQFQSRESNSTNPQQTLFSVFVVSTLNVAINTSNEQRF